MSEIDYPYDETMKNGSAGSTVPGGSMSGGSEIDSPASDSYKNRSAGMNDVDGPAVPRGNQIDSPMDD